MFFNRLHTCYTFFSIFLVQKKIRDANYNIEQWRVQLCKFTVLHFCILKIYYLAKGVKMLSIGYLKINKKAQRTCAAISFAFIAISTVHCSFHYLICKLNSRHIQYVCRCMCVYMCIWVCMHVFVYVYICMFMYVSI